MNARIKWFGLCGLIMLMGCQPTPGTPEPPIDPPGTPGPTNPPGDANTIKIFISNRHTQCNNDAVTPEQTQMTLVQGGIDVLGSNCGVLTGLLYQPVCGGATGEINTHRIRRENLVDAERLGFRNVTVIGTPNGPIGTTGFQEVDCVTRRPIP